MEMRSCRLIGCGLALAAGLWAAPASASENGASLYLLGSGGPGAAEMPPVPGIFAANTAYYYSGSIDADARLPLGGNIAVGVDATIAADFGTLLWIPTTAFAGGTLALGAILPVGYPDVDASAIITGPLGNQAGVSLSDSALIVGDPVVAAMVGWKRGDLHWQASGLVNIPVGGYREGQLANLAFHRWAGDASVAMTWKNPSSGWDVSGKAGVTFNGTNEATDYTTGTEFHIEGAVEKMVSKTVSLGVQAFHFQQLTGDSGPGASLGPFKGRVTGVGVTGAWRFIFPKRTPAALRLRAFKEFDVENRPEGYSIFLDLSFPLSMKLPAGAPH